jgi:hypothetical protein
VSVGPTSSALDLSHDIRRFADIGDGSAIRRSTTFGRFAISFLCGNGRLDAGNSPSNF